MTYCVVALADRPIRLYRETNEDAAYAAMHKRLCPAVVISDHNDEVKVVPTQRVSVRGCR